MNGDAVKWAIATVFKHLEAHYSASAKHWPGVRYAPVPAWIEPWLEVTVQKSRAWWTGLELALTVNVFHRVGKDSYGLMHEAGEVARLFKAATIEMKAWDAPGQPVQGVLCFDDPEIIDLGERSEGGTPAGVLQAIVRCRGRATPVSE